MLRDRDFSRNAAVDRYGRRLAKDDTKQQLERFYRLDDGDNSEKEAEDEGNIIIDDDADVIKELQRVDGRTCYDPARDGGFSQSSSDEYEETSSSEEEEEDTADRDDIEFPSKQQSDVLTGDITKRIAVVNMDWDNIRAEDLMAVFSSFLPSGDKIKKVTIYPSEFGKERMEREEIEGPPPEIFASRKENDHEDEDDEDDLLFGEEDEDIKQSMIREDEGREFDSTQLRRYQLERLRYFYAIVEFSSNKSAKLVYDAIDGTEYLSSANFFDLRFVPDNTDFSDDKPREQCERAPDGYKPSEFVTDALQHSKVKLTWDADDNARKEAQAKAFRGGRKEIEENDLKAYLGSDSSEGDVTDNEKIVFGLVDSTRPSTKSDKLSKRNAERQRMRALLGLGNDPIQKSKTKGPVGDMEITFTSGLAGEPPRESIFENESGEETTMEKYLRKQREKRARKKDRIRAAKSDENGPVAGEGAAKSASTVQEVDLGFDDPFFDEAPGRNTAGISRKEERRNRREKQEAEEAATATQRAELELLMVDDEIRSIKHFDMNEIEKAEKTAKKKGKKSKVRTDPSISVDDFQMDVNDPRFVRLYDNHEFAIDPTNSKFKGTSGMQALLEESRKRRRVPDEGDRTTGDTKRKRKKDMLQDHTELQRLIARLKSRPQ